MSKYQDRLIQYIREHPSYILPETRKNEVLGFLTNNQLSDLCISRPKQRLSWGIPLPFDDKFVTYVWFDALLNYYSATKYLAPQIKITGEETKESPTSPLKSEYWWPPDHHLIGKDILTTHAIYWSTMLMALGLPLPKNIFAHGWWTVEGKKMSKSFGNVVDPHKAADEFGADAFRYFLFREVPFGLDGDFSEHALISRINTDLANDLGNLVSRSLAMIEKYRDGVLPGPVAEKDRDGFERKIKAFIVDPDQNLFRKIDDSLRRLEFNNALMHLWSFISEINEYIQHSAPWKEADPDTLSNLLYTLAESLRHIALFLFPFMPDTAEKIWSQLNLRGSLSSSNLADEVQWGKTEYGIRIKKGPALFPRIDTGKKGNR